MKSIFTKLSTLVLCGAFALVSCSDFSADLKQVNEELDALAEKSATKTQVAELEEAIKELKAKLSEQYATIADVEAVITTIEGVQASLNDAKANLEAALDTKADKTTLQTAVSDLTDALTAAKTEIEGKLGDVDSSIESLGQKVADDLQALTEKVEEDLKAAKEALEGQIGDLENNLGDVEGDVENLQGTVGNIQTSLGKVIEDVDKLDETLSKHSEAFAEYKEEVTGKFEEVSEEITKVSESLSEQLEDLREEMAEKADAELVENVSGLQEALGGVNETLSTLASTVANKADKADVAADIQKVEKALASDIAALENVVKNWKDNDTKYDDTELRAAVAAATKEYKSLVADLQAQIDALENTIDGIHNELNGIKDELNGMKNELRGAVVVPQTMYNGAKAVKFQRLEGKNVLKTYATVSYHFNPANFDATKATYEIVTEKVEMMTRALINEEPAIEIIGAPVQENGKVTFELERGKGVANMFALKITLEDGCVIYSDYATILDEATFCVGTAECSVEVSRLALELPSLTSLSAIVEWVKSLGDVVEDYENYICAIQQAIEAVQDNDILGAAELLVKNIPGFVTKNQTIYGNGEFTVQVETLDAEQILENLMNAQSITEIKNILNSLIGRAEGLGGETGDAILGKLQNAINNSNLMDLISQFDNLNLQLPDLKFTYETAYNNYVQAKAKHDENVAGYRATIAENNAALEYLEANFEAVYNAEIAELEAQKEDANIAEKIILEAKILELKKDLKVGFGLDSKSLALNAENEYLEGLIKSSDLAYKGFEELLELAEGPWKEAEAKLAELEAKILDEVKNYIEESELGQYIKELENEISKQGWEGKKAVAWAHATQMASDAALVDLYRNYNAANDKVVEEFSKSLFGQFAYLIQTEAAATIFEELGLTQFYLALRQLPDLFTVVLKYYPTSLSGLTGIVPTVTSPYDAEDTWKIEYFIASIDEE